MTQIIEVPGMGEVEFPDDMSDDAIAAAIKGSAPAAPAPQEKKALGPWASAVVRPLAKGIAGLPLMAMDAGVGTRNAITGENYEHPSEMFNKALDSYTTVPEGIGAGAEGVSSMLAGGKALPNVMAAKQAPAGFASALPKAANAVQEFQQRGIPLTVGMRAGKAAKNLEDLAGNVPVVGGAIAKRQDEALGAWNTSLLKQLDPKVTQGGKEGFAQVGKKLSDQYKAIWKEELPFNRQGLKGEWSKLAGDVSQKLPREQADEVAATLSHQFKQILSGARTGGTQGATLESVDDALREAAKKAGKAGDGAVATAYNSARTAFRAQMDPKVHEALKQTDDAYMKLSVLRNAAKRSGWETFTPAQLLMASKKKASDAAVAEMRAPFQEEALKAADVLGTARSGAQASLERGVTRALGKTLGAGALGAGALADFGLTATGAGLGRLAYTKAGQKLLTQGVPLTKAGKPTARALAATMAQFGQENDSAP